MMNELPGTDNRLLERKINTDDVTGKLVDTKSRLETKKEMRLKYLELMKQSKDINEAVKAQADVNNIQEEIESTAGQVNYLSHQTAFSTIKLNYFQLTVNYKPNSIEKPSFFTRITTAFRSGAGWVADFIVNLLAVWPFLLLLLVAVFIWRKIHPQRFFTAITSPANKK